MPAIASSPGPTTVATDADTADAPALLANADSLPSVALTRDVMFHLLAAEVAFQRGDWQYAFATMFSVAQRTRDPRLAQRAFEIAWTVKRPEEALAASRLWRSLAPRSEQASQNYLNSVIMAERLDDAKVILERELKDALPQTRGSLIFQIQHLLARGANKSASFALLENLMAPYPDMLEAHLALAYGAFIEGDAARAELEAQIALKVKPDSEPAALILAQADPDKDNAVKFLAKFVSAHPKAKDLRITLARLLVEQKRYAEARRELEILLTSQPNDMTVLYMLGILEIQINDTKSAERHLTAFVEALENHPNDERDPTSALMMLSQIAEDRNNYDAALKWLDQAMSPEAYVGIQIRRAEIFGKQGNVGGARKLLAGLAPSDISQQIQVIAAEAQILRDAKQQQESMAVLDAGIKRFPDSTDLLYDYAMGAEKNNQLEACETALRKIIALAPKDQQAYNALGYTFAERNIRLDEAYALVDTALKLAPNDPFIMDSMGWVKFRLGKLNEAEELLRRAYSIRPDPEIGVHLGEVLWIRGQKTDAHKLWREISAKDPGNDSLKNTLARLHVSL